MPTILVADDNSNIQKMVGIALKDQGIDVVAVGNGEAAVRKLSEHIPDLILADIFMPVRNGYEVCEYVKKDDRFAHIPVVLLVGAFDPLDENEVERVRANGVLKKPFVPPDPLIELVKSLLKPAAAAPTDTQKLEEDEDIQQTQDLMPPHIPTGTVQVARPSLPPAERTQRLEPVFPTPGRPGGTVEVPRPQPPPADRTQPIEPFGGAEGFKLGLDEPATPQAVEKTAQLSAKDISSILHRDSPLTGPKAEAEEDEFSVPPPVVEFQGEGGPVAFQDLLEPAEEAQEEPPPAGSLGLAAFEAAATEEEPSAAEIHFGGIREEAKTPDPELPPIPVEFDQSEPLEIITEEHADSSGMHVAPAQDLVSSSSGWAASTGTGEPHAPEPELVSEGSEGFMTPPPAPPAPPSPIMMGIAREEEPAAAAAAAAPAPAIAPEAAKIKPEEFDDTTDLPKGILQAEVNRAQEIAARIAAQNREFIANQEAAGIPVAPPAIDQAISAVDSLLAKHRGAPAVEEPVAAAAPLAEPVPEPVVAAPVVQIPVAAAPAVAEAAPVRVPEPEPAQQLIAPTVRVARPATSPDVMEMISDRVLAQLDPYLIEKITKEIVRPIVEAIIKRELEKLE